MIEVKLPFDIIYDDDLQQEVLQIVITSQGIEKDENYIANVSSSLCEKYDITSVVISNIERKYSEKLKDSLYQINGIKIIEKN